MKHFILSALIMAASLSFYTATASAQVTIVSDETNLEMTFLKFIAPPEGKLMIVGYLTWNGESTVGNMSFDTASIEITDDKGNTYSGDNITIEMGFLRKNIADFKPDSNINFVITINGTDREATALTSISMPYKGGIKGNFKYDKTLKFK